MTWFTREEYRSFVHCKKVAREAHHEGLSVLFSMKALLETSRESAFSHAADPQKIRLPLSQIG